MNAGEVTVTQADREAAAKCHEKSCYEIVRIQGVQCRNGYADGDYLVQAFARHRIAAQSDLLALVGEAVEVLERISKRDEEWRQALSNWTGTLSMSRAQGKAAAAETEWAAYLTRATLAKLRAVMGGE